MPPGDAEDEAWHPDPGVELAVDEVGLRGGREGRTEEEEGEGGEGRRREMRVEEEEDPEAG